MGTAARVTDHDAGMRTSGWNSLVQRESGRVQELDVSRSCGRGRQPTDTSYRFGSGSRRGCSRVGRYLAVSEIFGPTIQGEGVSAGTPAMFLRVAGCPLSCSWCDTRYSWDWNQFDRTAETTRMTTTDVWLEIGARVAQDPVRSLVITGGEPGSQAAALADVARRARASGWRVEVETSGTVALDSLAEASDLITVSPKLCELRSAGRTTHRPSRACRPGYAPARGVQVCGRERLGP